MAYRGAAYRFLERLALLYEQLAQRAFADGIAHYEETSGHKALLIDAEARRRTLAKIQRFYQPSLLRLHDEVMQLALTTDDPEAVDRWFDHNAPRVDQAIEGLLWSAGEAGYGAAIAADGKAMNWVLDGSVERHCLRCPELADAGPYTGASLPAHPGDGSTPCQSRCYCYLDPVA